MKVWQMRRTDRTASAPEPVIRIKIVPSAAKQMVAVS
jgi:hypothetical protein